ncbi:MAG: hypothetical protein JWR16_2413 [Nevskia sp.]|nr:hypothetical protein [Nevskia sp.]
MANFKLAPRAVALVTVAALAACGGGGDGKDPQVFDSQVLFDPIPTISTDSAIIPFPFDGLFSGFSAPTLNIPNDPASSTFPVVDAINHLDGYSTIGDAFFDIAGFIDYSTLPAHVLIINGSTGHPLVYGTDYTLQNENATAIDPITHAPSPISSQRSRVIIELLKPLSPATTYLVGVTKGIATIDGGGVIASPEFQIVSSATPVSAQHNSELDKLNDAQKGALEALRSQLIYPAVSHLAAAGIAASDVVLAWTFTTQSEGLTLGYLAQTATARTTVVASIGKKTDQLGSGLPGGADVYAGFTLIPYYLKTATPDVQGPVTSFWHADPSKPNINPELPPTDPAQVHFLGQVPCAAFASGATVNGVVQGPSVSTTICYPVPVAQSTEKIPLIVTVPNADSGRTKPASGWPVVIFQHGITGNRTQMLAIGPALAKAGFVTVAIDLPLHGLTDKTSPFYHNQLFTAAAPGLVTGERTFDLDLENNSTGAPGGDGVIDSSGAYFINLQSLLTARDNVREAEADLLTLAKSVAQLDLNGDGTPDVNAAQIRFASLSLGSIVGIPFLANAPQVGAATIAVPGGGIAKLLDASKSIGPVISAGLAAAGVTEGSDDYETFLRFAQTAVDDGDPLNYAAAAAAAHPLHLIEVVNDLVVPNSSLANNGSGAFDKVTVSSFLGGTNPLVAAMGLTDLGTVVAPTAAQTPTINPAGLHVVVKFAGEASHGSILSPGTTPGAAAVTVEMQTETATFLGSNGVCLQIGGSCQ